MRAQPLPLQSQVSIVGSRAIHSAHAARIDFSAHDVVGAIASAQRLPMAPTAEGMPRQPAAGEKRKGEAVGGPKHPVMKQSKLNMWAKPHMTSPQASLPDPKAAQAAGRGRQRDTSVISID